MSTKQNKDIVCRFIDEAYNKRNLTVGDEVLAVNVVSVKDTIAEGDRVVASWTCHGIHTGELQGIAPTGKQVTWTGIAIYRFAGGKIEEVWVWNDIWGMMRQLCVISSG